MSSQVPVTALEAWNDLVLVGQGHFLRIYNRKTTELLSSTKVFTQQSIHGFVRQKGTKDGSLLVTIWGGRNVCFANVTREERESTTRITVDVRNTVEIDEWIFDVSLRPGIHLQSAQDAVLVTAHNKLFRLNVSQANELEIEHLFSGPRCILYSATIKWISTDQVVVASGTAFGEIVVWSLSFASNLIQAIRHFIFTGHEGSVFGVQISNHLSSREEPQLRLLTSCSDDRTIRVWDISNLSAGVVLAQTTPDEDATDTSRTTGFLNYVSDDAETASKSLYIASAMGHTSRIWNIHYAIDQDYQKFESYIISIISVGEDAACQIWHLYRGDEASNLGGFVLREGNSGNHHSGMNIWSSCVREFDESAHSFVTGGADGKVVEHQALLGDRGLCTPHMSTSEWDMTDFTTSLPISIESTALQDVNLGTNKKQSKKLTKLNVKPDCFRTFAFVCETQLLLTTNNGHVILVNLDEENAKVSSWRLIATYDSLKGYSVSCRLTSEPFHYLFLGDSRGNVYYFHSFFEEMKILTTIGGKITKLMAESLPSRSPDYLSIIVARHGGLETVQLLVKLGFGGTLILSSTTTFSCHYGQEKGTVPTITSSVLVTANSVDKDIALGCRDGSIYLYSNTRDQSDHCDAHLLLTHGGEAVTAMLWLPDPGGRNHSGGGTIGFLYSVGRDGTLAIHYIDAEENCFLFVHQLALPFGPNLEGLSLDPHTFDVSVWGFSGKHFVHHNVSALEDIFRIECGGAHRIWTFYNHKSSSTGSTKAMLGWLKIMKLNLTKVKGASHIVIQGGGHGREMTACAVAPVALNKDIGPLIATGAEDTDISLFYYAAWHGPCSELKLISILRKHNTGIQYLRWSEDGEFLFSCGGMEEFFVWRMRPTPGVTIGVVCEAVCPPMSPDSELRLLDFAVQGVYSAGNIPTGRVTAGRATKIRGANAKIFMITMIYSDSSFKVLIWPSVAELLLTNADLEI